MDDFISYLKIQLELIHTWDKCPKHRSHDIKYVHRNMLFCDECQWTKTALFKNSYEEEKRLGNLVFGLDNIRKGSEKLSVFSFSNQLGSRINFDHGSFEPKKQTNQSPKNTLQQWLSAL